MNSIIKKTFAIVLALSLALSLVACRKSPSDSSSMSDTSDFSSNAVQSEVIDSSTESQSGSDSTSEGSTPSDDKTSAQTPQNNKVTGTLGEAPKSLKGTTIKVYSWNNVNDVPGAADVIKKFKAATGIKVEWTVGSYDNYKSEIAAMVAAKTSPDIIRLRGVEPGILSLMDPVTVSGYDFKEDIWDNYISDIYTFSDKTYAVNRKNTLLLQPAVMFYNKELITKYDLDDPYNLWKRDKSNWNWDTFIGICNSYKQAAGPNSIPWRLSSYADYTNTFGIGQLKRDGNSFSSNMSDGNLLGGYQKVADWIANGTASLGWGMNEFDAGNYLFYNASIIGARRTHFYVKNLKTKGVLGVVPVPSVKGQSTVYQYLSEPEAYGIPKGAKNPAAVPYFLQYYLDGDRYDSNSFFNDKTILDVYKYCVSQTKIFDTSDRSVLQLDLGGTQYTEFQEKLLTASSAQILTLFNQYSPVIEQAAKNANNAISAMK